MAIAFVVAFDIGDEYEKAHPQTLKKHGYKPKATFRIGLDLILNWLMNHKNKLIRELKRIAKKVSDCSDDDGSEGEISSGGQMLDKSLQKNGKTRHSYKDSRRKTTGSDFDPGGRFERFCDWFIGILKRFANWIKGR